METPSHFFSDSVDIDGDHSYPETLVSSPRGSASHGGVSGYDSIVDENILTTSASSAPFVVSQDPLGTYGNPEMSLQDGTHSNSHGATTYCDPALLGTVGTVALMEHPSTTSSTPTTRSSTTRRSSSNSMHPSNSHSTSASSNPSAVSEPPKKKRGRKPKIAANVEEEEEKRSKFLEKNRVAASKCRQKKKEYVSELEETKTGLEHQNSHLQLEYHGLLGEVSRIKNQLMTHASCQDPNIDRWIQNEARKFVEGAQAGQGGQHTLLDGSSHGRRFSTASALPFSGMEGSPGYPYSSSRLNSLAYSDTSSLQASPTDSTYNQIPGTAVKEEGDINGELPPGDILA